ncbi:MAG: class B sortase [Lachnospiraceae bacterium]|nr:class B sortase [Lachnospiraceae bacterium]
MTGAKKTLSVLNGIYSWVVTALIMAAVAFAAYSIWDNAQIYQAAENVGDELRSLKPDPKGPEGPTFDDLRKINPDVCAWLTVDNTNIDYPVVQGASNQTYLDRDVYGSFSLAGSLFLDDRNKNDFSDRYSLIYGHHMDQHLMFGDLDLFKKKAFFDENETATLMIPGETRPYRVLAVGQISAGTEEVFDPDKWRDSLRGFAQFIKKNSIWYHENQMQLLISEPDKVDILSLVTCSNGSTNDRTVLILIRENPNRTNVEPTPAPSGVPSAVPTVSPTAEVTSVPTDEPATPTAEEPSQEPTAEPSAEPTAQPTSQPTATPTSPYNQNSHDNRTGTNTKNSSDVQSGDPTVGRADPGTGSVTGTNGGSDTVQGDLPKTADTRNPDLWKGVIIAMIALIAAIEIHDRMRSRREDEE